MYSCTGILTHSHVAKCIPYRSTTHPKGPSLRKAIKRVAPDDIVHYLIARTLYISELNVNKPVGC